ncbi:MAG: ion transporter [Ghiorsea sp.]
MRETVKNIVAHVYFEYFIVAVILINAVVIGMETSPDYAQRFGVIFEIINDLILGIFIIEAAMKMFALSPKVYKYFQNGWNLFDFSIIVLSLIPSTGGLAMLARLARLLRVFRLITVIPELRLIVATLVRSIPSMGNIMILMSIIFYIFAVAGQQLFHEHDPEHWDNLGISLLSLFRIVTLEDWTDLMYTTMEVYAYSWIYFVSFVILGTFVIINLFIAIVLNNLDEAKQEELESMRQPLTNKQLMQELDQTQKMLADLRSKLDRN